MNYELFIIVNIEKTAAIADYDAIRCRKRLRNVCTTEWLGGSAEIKRFAKTVIIRCASSKCVPRNTDDQYWRNATFGYSILFITHVLDLRVRRLSFEPHVHTFARVRPTNIICAKCARPIRKPRANTYVHTSLSRSGSVQ